MPVAGRHVWQASVLLRWIRPRSLVPLLDAALVVWSASAALWVTTKFDGAGHASPSLLQLARDRGEWFLLLSAGWVLLAAAHGVYSSTGGRADGRRFSDELGELLGTSVSLVVVYMVLYFFAVPRSSLPRRLILYTAALGFMACGSWRFLAAALGGRDPWRELRERITVFWVVGPHRVQETSRTGLVTGAAQSDQVRLLTVRQVAQLLNVHESTIWRWCNNGMLEAFRVGQQWRIPASAVDAMAESATEAAPRP